MKYRIIFSLALFMCTVSGCTSLSDKSEIRELFGDLKREIKTDQFNSDKFFTPDGWHSTLLFLGYGESNERLVSFLDERSVRSIKQEDEYSYRVFMNKSDPVIGRVKFLVTKESGSFRISKCIASR